MKRSASLPHIPTEVPSSKRHRHTPCFTTSVRTSSLLCLPDDVLLRIFRMLCGSPVIDTTASIQLPRGLPIASTCRRLHLLFFKSIHTIDCIVPHISHSLPPHYHTKKCTTCPSVVPFSAIMLLVRRSCLSIRTLRLPNLDIDSTALVMSTVAEHCLNVRTLAFTDNGAINQFLANALLSSRLLTSLEVCEPHDPLLETLATSPALFKDVSLVSVATSRGPLITRFLNRNGSNLRKLSLSFFDERRFLAEPFAFPRLNLHDVYPDMHLNLSTPIANVLASITRHRFVKLPLLSEFAITTLGADLNQEGCDLINCPPPVEGLDSLRGAVFLVREATPPNLPVHPLQFVTLRTDHLVLHASLQALSGLLSPRINLLLHVNDLTLEIPPVFPTMEQKCPKAFRSIQKDSSTMDAKGLLKHAVHSARLSSLLHSDVKISSRSDFTKLHTLDIGSAQFCVEYGRNPEAFRSRLATFLRIAEPSLRKIRFTNFVRSAFEGTVGKAFVLDVLSHAPQAVVLELSDEFLVTALYHESLSDMFIYLRNFRVIRFGSLSWVSYNSVGAFTRVITEFFHILPGFFRAITQSCPHLTQLVLVSTYHACWAARPRERQSLQNALRALNTLEQALPRADTSTVRTQLSLWLSKTRLSR